MQRARSRARRAESGPTGGGARSWALPEPTPPGTAARSRGDSWARQSPAAAAGGPPPLPPSPPHPPHRWLAGCSLPGAPAAAPRGASRARGAGCQAADFGVPSASRLSSSRDPHLFSCAQHGRQAAIAALFHPLQNEGKSRAGERRSRRPPSQDQPRDSCAAVNRLRAQSERGPGVGGTGFSGACFPCLVPQPPSSLIPRATFPG